MGADPASPVPRAASAVTSRHRLLVAVACICLLLLFAVLAWIGIRGRSATFDEPVHVTEAWVAWHQHDYRIDPENPVLWLYWAALPQPSGAIKPADSPYWPLMLSSQQRKDQLALGRELLYRTPGLDADAFVNRSRVMMLAVAVALGGVIAWWSWKLGGGVAAIAATAAFALDPNFLAHGPLVKNDVAIALLTAAILLCTWMAGRRLTVANALGLALLSGAALVTKFSAIILVLIPPALLVGRAAVPREWTCFGRSIASRAGKLLVAVASAGLIAVASYVIIWATYGFRFGPVPGSDTLLLPTARLIDDIRDDELYAAHPDHAPTSGELESWRPPLKIRAVLLAERHRLLPQTWLHGLLFTYRGSLLRPSFLCGLYSESGFALYYPQTFLFKTPLATLAAFLLAMALGVTLVVRRAPLAKQSAWAAACLGVPVGIYGVASMMTVLDLGVRYLLPIYPLLFIAIGWALAYARRRWEPRARLLLAALGLALAVETLAAFPSFIPFFNAACGGERGGLELLGDSNLDWGQDLKGLAQWWRDYQRRHPETKLYLSYFGNSSPRYYGLRFTSLPGDFAPADESDGPPRFPTSGPALLAISATNLQGIYFGRALRQPYAALRKERPIAVIGGSIYVYELP
jgi:hypothetical protein